MVESIINSIIEAEAQAAAEIKSAQISAKEILFKAEVEKDNIRESYLKDIKVAVKAINDEADRKANSESDKIIATGKAKAEELIKSVNDTKDKATDSIVGRILSKYGNN